MAKDAKPIKILFLISEDWYFLSHRLDLARACRDAGWEVAVATRTGKHADLIRKEGFSLLPIGMRRGGRKPFRELATLIELIRLYRDQKPDIVHHVALKPVIYGSIAARITGVKPVINTLAGMGYVFLSGRPVIRLIRWSIKIMLKQCLGARRHWLIVQNQVDAKLLSRPNLAAPDRTVVIRGSGVDIHRFAPAPEPPGPVVVAVVSRMLNDKGIRELVLAARGLQLKGLEIEFWLVGDPDPENPTSISEDTLRQWDTEGCVRWLGYQDDIASIWAKAHIAALPSYREGMPMSLLEAAACGRPIVTTNVPGCNELVKDGKNGFLVQSGDWIGLAQAIGKLALSADLRARLGAAAREEVCGDYARQTVISRTTDLYRLALEVRTETQPLDSTPRAT